MGLCAGQGKTAHVAGEGMQGWTHFPAGGTALGPLCGLSSLKPSLLLPFLGERSLHLPLEGEISPEVMVTQMWAGLCLGVLVINGLQIQSILTSTRFVGLCSALGTGNWGAGTGQQLNFAGDDSVAHCIGLTQGESWKSLLILAFKGFFLCLKSTSAVSG